jgi:hypothetical protein
MLKKTGLLLAFAATVLLLLPAAASADDRLPHVLRGLDYLHAKQEVTGGFTVTYTSWCILAIRAAQESVTADAWTVDGKDPFSYINGLNHTSVAGSGDVSNVPSYYSKTIMAYVAAGKKDKIYSAGVPPVDLLAELLKYRHDDGHFSLAASNPDAASVNTTIWAVLAMHSAGIGDSRLTMAVDWLYGQALDNGGFPSQPGRAADVDDTAAAIQALMAGGVGSGDPVVQNALGFLREAQRSDGGFPSLLSDSRTYAESTAWAIQAISAAGQDPEAWTVGDKNPVKALKALQAGSGAFEHYDGQVSTPLLTTPQAIIALSGADYYDTVYTSFNRFPRSLPKAVTPMVFRPRVSDMIPASEAKLTSSTVTFSASYSDGVGTGVALSKVRILVDGTDRTKSATVGAKTIALKLTGVPYGTHRWELVVPDRAGNVTRRIRTFSVLYSPSSSTPAPTPTYPSSGGTSGTYPTTRPTPTTTLYPTPNPSLSSSPTEGLEGVPYGSTVTGTPLTPGMPSPSPSAIQPTEGDEGGNGGVIGGALLAALPIGATLSYLTMRRHAGQMAAAGTGKILGKSGTPWQRFSSNAGAAWHRLTSRSSRPNGL